MTARLALAVLAVFAGFGCGSQQVVPSAAQPPKTGSNSVLIQEPFEEVWSRAIPRIGKSSFAINTIDKSSGILIVGYAGDPEKYVDCGTIHADLGVNHADFPVAKVRQQWFGPAGSGLGASYTQHVTLSVRMNIVFERVSSNSTRATVDARYVVTRTVAKGVIGGGPAEVTEETASFNSGGKDNLGSAVCMPNGKFESEAMVVISSLGTGSSIK